jgi:pimeloyl-ACP methyl ester carboxylesterase
MKKILLAVSFFICVACSGQNIYSGKIAGLNAIFYTSPGLDTTQPVNLLLFTPGAGEQGTDITKLLIHGPFQFLKATVDIKVPLLVVAVQNINANPQPLEYQSYIDGIRKLYKINKIVLTGLSRGGQNAEWFANYSEAHLAEIAGMIVFSSQGTVSDYPGVPGTLNPSLYLKYNIPIWRGVGDQDFTWPINQGLNNALSSAAPKLAIWTTWPGAGHGDPVWVQGYEPFPTPTNPIYVTMKMSIYQWASSIMGSPPAPPVVITYKSAAESQVFTRNCVCGTPVPVIYTVPAGKYTSTVSQAAADQFAMSDLSANGQAYANANGICIPILVYILKHYSDGTIIKINPAGDSVVIKP